ncbi:MAG: metal-dependent hydrolase [Bacillota bacterium]
MAQLGIHGIVGLYGGKAAGSSASGGAASAGTVKSKKDFAFGFVLGNLLPDTDFFLLVFAYLVAPKAAVTLHRSFSHSLITITILTAILVLARDRAGRPLGWGIGLGMLTHSVLDMFVWFSAVNFLWPLNYLGIPSTVNLWANFTTTPLLSNLLGAADYLAFALYFLLLRSAAKRTTASTKWLPRLNFFINLNWLLTVVYGALSFFLNGTIFNIIHYAVFTLVMLPIVLWTTFKFRPAIEAFATAPTATTAAKSAGTPA